MTQHKVALFVTCLVDMMRPRIGFAAIRALEARSLEFMHEKEEKKKLEQRIAMLMGQMIRGDRSGVEGTPGRGEGEVNPEIHTMIKEQQEKMTKEYEFKLADLERERETIEEEKAQVDRYKQLLLKQRDIMIALTQRLVERDEQIMALQDELDAERIAGTLAEMRAARHCIARPPSMTPFAFPLLVARLRERLSSEQLSERVARMVALLEKAAGP